MRCILRGARAGALVIGVLGAAAAYAATPETISYSATDTARTWQTPLLAGSTGEDRGNCVENVTCDTLVLLVQPGNYVGKQLRVQIDWTSPASDVDLYVFRDRLDGDLAAVSDDFVPQTRESAPVVIDAVLTQPRRYVVQVVGQILSAPEMIQGRIRLQDVPQPRVASFLLQHDVRFSPNVTVAAPATTRDCEPSIRVDVRGNCYVGGIRGVPAGVDLWRFDLDPTSPGFDPLLRNAQYLGQPDAFAPGDTAGGRDGGGDIDISTSFPASPSATPVLTITSLALANISSAVSNDRGDNFALSPAVATSPADDRQWNESTGPDTVYLFYRAPIPASGLFVQRSTDHGATYGPALLVSPTGSTPGYIDVDHANGYVYVSHMTSSALLVSVSKDRGQTWKTVTVDNGTTHGHLFDPVKVADDGTVYAAWTDNTSVYLVHSSDHGDTWSRPVKVNGPETKFALMPWLETGSAGRVAVAWYAGNQSHNWNSSDWRCWLALVTDATGNVPVVRLAEVSDKVIHASNLSEGGLVLPPNPEPNRNLCDYFQVAVDPQGACVVAFTDDHNDYDGHTFVARQISGTSLYASANGGTGELVPVTPTPLPTPGPGEPEVSDFVHDANGGNLQVIPTDSPYDILSIDYDCHVQGVSTQLEVRMKVSDLSPVPANSFWRVNFTANAPGTTADRGNPFYLLASTGDDPATPTFTFGSAVRDTNGDMLYTSLGAASYGVMDTTTNEVVMRLALSAMDPYVTQPVRPGSPLVGLRGHTGTLGAATARDITRGSDGPFVVCGELLDADRPAAATFGMSRPTPNPGRDGASVNLSLSRAAWVELAVFDSQGRRVRTVHAGVLPAGTTRVRWDGRTDTGHAAASGVYYIRMMSGGEMRNQHLILVR